MGQTFGLSGKKSEIFPSPPLCRPDIGGQGDLNRLKHHFIPFIVNSQVSTDFALSNVWILKATHNNTCQFEN